MLQNLGIISLLMGLVSACGETQVWTRGTEGQAHTRAEDSEHIQDSMTILFTELLEALRDSHLTSASREPQERNPNKVSHLQRSCTEDGNSAIVSVQQTAEHKLTRVEGNDDSVQSYTSVSRRKWTLDGQQIDCGGDHHVSIDSKAQLTGLMLKVAFSHDLGQRRLSEPPAPGASPSGLENYSAEGERTATWGATIIDADDLLIHHKTLTSSSVRHHWQGEGPDQGRSRSLRLMTAASDPLRITVTHHSDRRQRQLKSTLIETGSFIATHEGEGRLVATFDRFRIDFDEQGCAPLSGQVLLRVEAGGKIPREPTYLVEAKDRSFVLRETQGSTLLQKLDISAEILCDRKGLSDF